MCRHCHNMTGKLRQILRELFAQQMSHRQRQRLARSRLHLEYCIAKHTAIDTDRMRSIKAKPFASAIRTAVRMTRSPFRQRTGTSHARARIWRCQVADAPIAQMNSNHLAILRPQRDRTQDTVRWEKQVRRAPAGVPHDRLASRGNSALIRLQLLCTHKLTSVRRCLSLWHHSKRRHDALVFALGAKLGTPVQFDKLIGK